MCIDKPKWVGDGDAGVDRLSTAIVKASTQSLCASGIKGLQVAPLHRASSLFHQLRRRGLRSH